MSIEILYIECKTSIILSVASWSTIATKMDASTCGRPSSLVREISYKMFSERDDDGTNLWRQIFSLCSLRYSYWTSTELHVPTLQRKFRSGSQWYFVSHSATVSNSPMAIAITQPFSHRVCRNVLGQRVRDADPTSCISEDLKHRTHCLVETHRPRWT